MAYCIVIQTLNKTETGVYHLWGTIGGLGPLAPPLGHVPGYIQSVQLYSRH